MEFVDIAFYVTYALLVIGVLAAVVMPLISAFGQPKTLVKTGIGVGALILLYFISYAISGDEVTAKYLNFDVDATASKFIGGALIMMYLIAGILIVSIIYTEVSRLLK